MSDAEWRKRATDEYHVSASEGRDNRRRTVTRALKGMLNKSEIAIENGLMNLPSRVESDDWGDDLVGADQ